MKHRLHATYGQVTTETILLAPIFFLGVFLAIQVCHLGLGVAIVQYATSSVARQAVQDNSASLDADKFKRLLGAGLKEPEIQQGLGETVSPVTKNITVVGCAKLGAYPFVGQALKAAQWKTDDTCAAEGPLVSLSGGGPFDFMIRARTTIRLNYQR